MSTTNYIYGGLSASTISAYTISTSSLKVNNPGSGTSITALGVDANGNVVSGATAGIGVYWTSGSTGLNSIIAINSTGVNSTGNYAVAVGNGTSASGPSSFAQGEFSTASGDASHAEGAGTTAQGSYSHAEGIFTKSIGSSSHAEGQSSTSTGDFSHSQNQFSKAIAANSHAGGYSSVASGNTSFIHSTNSLVTGARSAVLGGQNITGTTADTVYVPNLNINTTPSNNDSLTQLLVRDTDGTIKYRSSSSISGATGVFGISNSGGTYTYYATLSLAMSAATSGQTIEIFADYTETGNVTITLKDGVNINGNGHTYIHSYAGGNSNTFENTSGVISLVISNFRVIRTGRANGTSGDYVFNATINDSQFFFSDVYFESTYGNCVNLNGTTWQYKPHQGNLYAKAYLTAITTQGSISGFVGQSTSSGKGIYGLGGMMIRCSGYSITGSGLDGTGTLCEGFSSSGIGLAGTFRNSYGFSTTYRAGDGSSYTNCTLISTSGFAGTNGTYKNCTLISSSGQGAGPYLLNAHDNCYIESTSNIAVGGGYSGIFRNCVVVSNWNNSGGHGFSIGNNSIITNSHIKVSNTSANCIYNGSAISIKHASNIFEGATTPVNANVTQGAVTTQDNQGNITL